MYTDNKLVLDTPKPGRIVIGMKMVNLPTLDMLPMTQCVHTFSLPP